MAISTRHKWLNGLLAGTLCVVAVCVVQQASVVIAADWSSSMTRHDLGKWATGNSPYTPEQWEHARANLLAAIALTPQDATLHDALAQLHGLQGRALWTTGTPDSPEVAAYQEAMSHQLVSLRVRPMHAMAWANLAMFQFAVNSEPEPLFKAWREAARLGPREQAVVSTLLYLATEMWPIAPDDMRRWVRDTDPKLAARLEALPASQ